MSRKGCGCDGNDLDQFGKCQHDICPKSQRVDGNGHSFVFDGDDPYVVCAYCKERRDAISGRIIPTLVEPNLRAVFVKLADQVYTDIHNHVTDIDGALLLLRGVLEQKYGK